MQGRRDLGDEAVVPKRCPLPAAEAVVPRQREEGLKKTIPFSSMPWFSLLQIDVDMEKPQTTENPTQSFEIHNIVWRRRAFGRDNIYNM